MSSIKRRKLDKDSAAPKSISAIAARKLRQSQTLASQTTSSSNSSDTGGLEVSRDSKLFNGTLVKNLSDESRRFRTTQPVVGNDGGNGVDAGANMSDTPDYGNEEEVEFITTGESREHDGTPVMGPPAVQLTTLKVNKSNVKDVKKGVIWVKIEPGERIVLLGQYGLCVVKGQVTILGAVLRTSENVHQVHALASHSLPVIRCASDSDGAEVKLYQYDPHLQSLKLLSPLFSRLCDEDSSFLADEQSMERVFGNRRNGKSSFRMLFSTGTNSQKQFVWPVISPPEWNEVLSKLTAVEPKPIKVMTAMVCGPKSSGKSTFTRLLTNNVLTRQTSVSPKRISGVAILDLDPGQPEFSPPGQLSLVHLLKPNFGPPYSHPVAFKGAKTMVRAHSIGAISPAADSTLYSSCLRDLLYHYRQLLKSNPGCPLIINTPGWVLGTGLELLVDIIKSARPTNVIYMSQEGPWEVANTLRDAAKPTPLYSLPSQLSEYTTRTAANLRTMQMMSYFHAEEDKNGLKWNSTPLTSVAPWEVQYSGKAPGILGILCLGEQPPPNMLKPTINGNILAVVVIDDTDAIPGWSDDGQGAVMHDGALGAKVNFASGSRSRGVQTPLIVQTPEGLPYFNPANATTLNPRLSHSVGLVLVRGIDIERQKLQLLTPIPPSIIEEARNSDKHIVLISGKLDTPGWAYTEELNRRAAVVKAQKHKHAKVPLKNDSGRAHVGKGGEDEDEVYDDDSADSASEDEGDDTDEFDDVPWIEKVHGHEGRGVGARVWRVRRDLGRAGDGD